MQWQIHELRPQSWRKVRPTTRPTFPLCDHKHAFHTSVDAWGPSFHCKLILSWCYLASQWKRKKTRNAHTQKKTLKMLFNMWPLLTVTSLWISVEHSQRTWVSGSIVGVHVSSLGNMWGILPPKFCFKIVLVWMHQYKVKKVSLVGRFMQLYPSFESRTGWELFCHKHLGKILKPYLHQGSWVVVMLGPESCRSISKGSQRSHTLSQGHWSPLRRKESVGTLIRSAGAESKCIIVNITSKRTGAQEILRWSFMSIENLAPAPTCPGSSEQIGLDCFLIVCFLGFFFLTPFSLFVKDFSFWNVVCGSLWSMPLKKCG